MRVHLHYLPQLEQRKRRNGWFLARISIWPYVIEHQRTHTHTHTHIQYQVLDLLDNLKLGGCIENDDYELLRSLTSADVAEYHDPLDGFLGAGDDFLGTSRISVENENADTSDDFGKERESSSIFDDLESLSLTNEDFKKSKKKKKKSKKKDDEVKIQKVDAKEMSDFMDILVAPMDTSLEESSVGGKNQNKRASFTDLAETPPVPSTNKRSSFTDLVPESPPIKAKISPTNKRSSFTEIMNDSKGDDEPKLDLDQSKRKGNFIWDRNTSLWWNPKTKYLFDQKKKLYTRDNKTWFRYDRSSKKLVAV